MSNRAPDRQGLAHVRREAPDLAHLPDDVVLEALEDAWAERAAAATPGAARMLGGPWYVAIRALRVTAGLLQAAAEANERIATCHERVACPRCSAPVGARCRSMLSGTVTKHPHRERWTLVQAAR